LRSFWIHSLTVAALSLSITGALAVQAAGSGVIIDGKLNDSFWQRVVPQKLTPSDAGVPPAMGGQIRAVVAGRYLYLAAQLPEPGAHVVAQSVGFDPVWEGGEQARRITMPRRYTYGSPDGEDFVRFIIRVYNENDWMLQVGPLGGYSVKWRWTGEHTWFKSLPYKCDGFLVATSIQDDHWTVEAAIPLEQIGSPLPGYIQLAAARNRAQRPETPQEWWYWPAHEVTSTVPTMHTTELGVADPVYRPSWLGNNQPAIQVGHVPTLPPLYSKWTDLAWRDVPAWTLRRNETAKRLPKFPTEVKFVQDGQTLAVLARCIEPDRIIATVKERDGEVTSDDSFQVFLATTGSSYVEYAINAEGYILDAAGHQGSPRLGTPYADWNSPVRGAAWKSKGEWMARLDLPLETISQALGEVRIPRDWRILLMRFRPGRDGEPAETSQLPVTQSLRPYCPARYRRVELVNADPSQLPTPKFQQRAGDLAFLPTDVLSVDQRKQMNLSHMLERYTEARGEKIVEREARAWDKVHTLADWERFRDSRISALKASLEPFPKRAHLGVHVTSEFRGDGYRRQNIVYQSQPGVWVTANLYLPDRPKEQMPGIILIHSLHGPKTQFELQDMGIMWAREGCVVLAMDQIGYGERTQTYPWDRASYHSRYTMGEQLYLVGSSLMTWMYWDIDRGVDLLWQRPDVSKKQIMIFGGVAGGGDPAAVVAALDPRVSVSVPFNFGVASPLTNAEFGDWESTRSLRLSIADQFLPWLICASVAPRYFVFSHEIEWSDGRGSGIAPGIGVLGQALAHNPAWIRYQKVWGFYHATGHVAEAHGFGPFPGPGEAWSIGPGQRRSLEPILQRWFGIPIPWEDQENTRYENLAKRPIEDRRPVSDLMALNAELASELHAKPLNELVMEQGQAQVKAAREKLAAMPPGERQEWLRREWRQRMGGDIEPNPAPESEVQWTKETPLANVEAVTLSTEPGITVPMLLMLPKSHAASRVPVVVAVSEGGKDLFVDKRSSQIEALLSSGYAVCLPDVRGTGETTPGGQHDPDGVEITLSAADYMIGDSLLGQRLKDLRTVFVYLRTRQELDPQRIGLWGDSFTPPNPPRILKDELPQYQIGPEIEQHAEPLGGMLAILGALYENNIKAVAVHGGLVSFLSMLDDSFPYVPQDVIVPGVLEVGDIGSVAAALAPRPLVFEASVNGKDQLVSANLVRSQLISPNGELAASTTIRAGEGVSDFAGWFRAHL
jgi:cephalosporin-C deacetylase-like acetyl esterase